MPEKTAFTMAATGDGVAEIRFYNRVGPAPGISPDMFAEQLVSFGDVSEIRLLLDSPGGVAFDGLAIYNELQRHPAHIVVEVMGLAASAASVIAMAGDEIVMREAAFLMVHNASGLVYGTMADMEDMAKTLAKLDRSLADIYARKSGQSARTARAWMKEETWFTASEAVKAGLADRAVEPDEGGDEDLAASAIPEFFNYKHVPEALRGRITNVAFPPGVPSGDSNSQTRPEAKGVIAMPENTDADLSATVAAPAPAPKAPVMAAAPIVTPASFDDIVAECPGADSAFIVEQLAAHATADDARRAYAKRQSEEVAALKAQMVAAMSGGLGVAGVNAGAKASADSAGDPIEAWETAVGGEMANGKSRRDAIFAVVRERPDLQAAYVEAHNAKYRATHGR